VILPAMFWHTVRGVIASSVAVWLFVTMYRETCGEGNAVTKRKRKDVKKIMN